MDLKELNKQDKLKKQQSVSVSDMGSDLSPMDPPDTYNPPSRCEVDLNTVHPAIKLLFEEHEELTRYLESFQKTLNGIAKERSFTPKLASEVKEFIHFFEREFHLHNKKEEQLLFRLIDQRLIEKGECGIDQMTGKPFTGIKVLEDDHLEAVKLATKLFYSFELLMSVNHPQSRSIILSQFLNSGHQLIELVKLHIFREDNIIFGQAVELLSDSEFDQVLKQF